ncbi:MAG: putative lipid II flippase FtsW [Gammaproteobacteria bacterium]|nr:MAG: putative lipid II flippase FtsW [Gammaproteobacteria bacterium]
MSAVVVSGNARRVAGQERPGPDLWLLGSVLALMVTGFVMVYSASISTAYEINGDSSYYATRHAMHMLIGLVSMLVVMYTPVRFWQAAGPYLLMFGLVLLVAVLIPGIGTRINGSSRWVNLGLMKVQPSEFMKVFMVIYVAGYLVRRQEILKLFVPGILRVSFVVAIAGMLLLQEPDLGSVIVICITVLSMLFLAGVRFWHFMLIVGTGIGGMVLLTLVSPYRLGRVTGFLDPFADPFNTGFQLVQALIAFGRGEWLGVGLGASIQKLSYLPAAHTDFLLAVIAEELGLVGVVTIIMLFAIIVYRGLVLSRKAEAVGLLYSCRLTQGICILLGSQALINMGVNMGLLPTKGLTLPFMSYGGSSMVASSIAVGLLLMVERQVRSKLWQRR